MSIQKLNIRIPDRPQLSQMLTSKPCPPIPLPIHMLNQMNNARPIDRPGLQPVNISGLQGYPMHSYTNNSPANRNTFIPVQQYQNQMIPTKLPAQIPVPLSPNHQNSRSQLVINSPIMRRDQIQHQSLIPRASISPPHSTHPTKAQQPQIPQKPPTPSPPPAQIRPKSPKIQFKYVSPPKQHHSLSEIKQISDSSIGNQNHRSPMPSESSKLEDHRFTEYKKMVQSEGFGRVEGTGDIQRFQNQAVNSSLKTGLAERNSITNYIYLVENKNANSTQPQPKPTQSIQKQPQPKQQMIKTTQKQNSIQKQNSSSQIDNQPKASESEIKLRLKFHDESINEMMKQYDYLKYSQEHDNSSNRLPRISKNSSDQNDDDQYRRSGIRSGGNSNINPEALNQQHTFGVILDRPPSAEDPPLRIRESENKHRESINNAIKEDTAYVIEGIQNVKSEVLDGEIISSSDRTNRILKLESQQKQYAEYKWQQNQSQSGQISYQLKQKQLEIKNLKNQVWLMKLRQNELLTVIKKLQSVNKEQQGLIEKLMRSKEK